jgi:hypothetical protein
MSRRLNCPFTAGPGGRVSPSLIAAERNERLTAKRPATSFKTALDDALEELDTQAEDGQVSSGAYVNLAKRLKTVYDSHSGQAEGMKQAVIHMVLEDAENLRVAPEEVDWPSGEFLEELLDAASKKMHDSTDESSLNWEDWVDDLLGVYINQGTEMTIFWSILGHLTSVIPRSPLCIAAIFSQRLGYLLSDLADTDKFTLQVCEPVSYSREHEAELMSFWVDKFKMFPSYDFYLFMTTLFDNDCERIESRPFPDEYLFREKVTKKIKRCLKRVCECPTCSRIYRRWPTPESPEDAARAARVAALKAKGDRLEQEFENEFGEKPE